MIVNFKNTGREFQALLNNAAIGIIAINSAGEIILVNQFALKQFGGYEEEELLGEKIEVLIPRRYRERHVDHRENFKDSTVHSRPMGVGMDLYAVKKDGSEFPVEVSLSSYVTENGRFSIAFVSDITIRKQSENELLLLNAQLEQKVAERTQSLTEALEKEKELNELKSRFVTMASHEFRTPLSTILSSAYLVAKYTTGEDQPKRDRHIQRIVSSVNMLSDILNDFLSVGKIEEGRVQVRMVSIDVPAAINDLINEMQSILKPGQHINYKHTGAAEFWLDPSLLRHILMNLVSNAIKFSLQSSVIHITTDATQDQLMLSVRDEGMGISPADQEHLFERFFRGANVTNIQGTGLGLHIVAKYAELMNGTINCNSELEKGTEFTIKFNRITE